MVSQSKLGTGVITSVKTQKLPKIYAVPPKGCRMASRIKRIQVIKIDKQHRKFGAGFETTKMPDTNNGLYCLQHTCLHLSGGSWKFVYGNGKPVKDLSKFVGVTLC